ncbi:MAG: zinc metallopeptidase [Alphaproteobacteria bacterium]|nr:zinc metallopeptidase [Alphaproteobacteria bacterium]
MPLILLGILLVAAVFGPSLWAKAILAKHGDDRADFPGTGGELARHLLDEAGLSEVAVEATDAGDHYDPTTQAVRLSPDNFDGRSLTAVTVAAHEVGHAIQNGDNYGPLLARTNLIKSTQWLQRLGSIIVFAAFGLGAVVGSPILALVGVGAGIATMGSTVVVHLVTLPVEFDTSFNRALPILDRGGYLPRQDLPAARRILKACALTYVASSLAGLLNLWRWIRYLR